MKILVIGPSWIGDMMMSHSLYRTLKNKHPTALIDVIAPAWSLPLLYRMPEINEALDMPFKHGTLEISARYQFSQILKIKNYNCAYVLPNSFKSGLIPFFAGIPHRIGWVGEMRYGILNDIRFLNKKKFPLMVERYIALSYERGYIKSAKELPKPLLLPYLKVHKEEKKRTIANFSLNTERPLIGFCPGAEFGPAKKWPHYHYASLAKYLIEENYYVILFGSEKDSDTNKQIINSLEAKHHIYCRNLAGKTHLEQAIILLSACKIIVSNDSGLMHIAAALEAPMIVLYGPSTPYFTPPLSQKVCIIRLITGYHKIRKTNTNDGYHQSLIDITPEQVINEIKRFLPNNLNEEFICKF